MSPALGESHRESRATAYPREFTKQPAQASNPVDLRGHATPCLEQPLDIRLAMHRDPGEGSDLGITEQKRSSFEVRGGPPSKD